MTFNIVKCSEIIDVRDGTHDSPKYIDKGYPLVTSKNIKNNKIDFENINYISREDFENINKRSSVDNGDILMPMIGTVGNPVLVDTNINFAIKNVALFKLSNNDLINNKYFYYLLKSNYVIRQLEKYKRGGTQSFVSLKNLRELKIPLPSLEEQERIVSILEKAENAIEKREESIKLLDELVKSRFIEMFGDPVTNPMNWEKRTLNEVSLRKGEYGSGASAIEYIKDYPRYIRITDINDSGKLNNNKVTIENLSEYEKYKLNDGDILFARTGATVGKTFRYRESDGECLFAGYLIRFIPNMDIINPDFLFAFTKTSFYQSWVDAKQNTVAQPNINAKQYGEELEVILPPIETQNKFTNFVKQVDKLKFEMENSLKELENNFNSLIQKAFKGELFQ
ncbi:restriction endonuclease subunit S [Paraclostridium ghonii]|uniref:restriction endonuclease subunit S n=1 Tax=Paraclostridium ghonii TaxID=29358 RepID=UPI00202CE6F4|nr:restriction endonuclease subunit S [Paeniclostridium ghonii]MCM0166404.1 restriction endonuclease subunit S [Paeniclostridium ghonii]